MMMTEMKGVAGKLLAGLDWNFHGSILHQT